MRLIKFLPLIIINSLYDLSFQKNISEVLYSNHSFLNDINDINDLSNSPSSSTNYINIILAGLDESSPNIIIYLLNNALKNGELLKTIENLLRDIFTNSTYKEELKDILKKYKDEFNNLIDLIIQKNSSYFNIIGELIVKEKPIYDLIYNTGILFPNILDLLKFLIVGDEQLAEEVGNFTEFMKKNYDKIFNLVFDIYKNRNNDKEVTNLISYFLTNNTDISKKLCGILKEGNIFKYIMDHNHSNNLFLLILKSLAANRETFKELFEIFENSNDLLLNLAREFENMDSWNQTIIILPKFLVSNDEIKSISSKISINLLKYALKEKQFYDLLIMILKEAIGYLRNLYSNRLEISEGCLYFLDHIVLGKRLGEIQKDSDITRFYLYKFFFETTSGRNDILIYEKCLDQIPSDEEIKLPSQNNLNHSSSFLVSLVNLSKRKKIIKNNTHFEDYYYILGFCVPQGLNSEANVYTTPENKKVHLYCSLDDYDFILNSYLRLGVRYEEEQDIQISSIEINRFNETIKFSKDYMKLIPSLITLIPLSIFIFLLIYRTIFIRNKKDVKMIDQTNYSQMKKDDDLGNIKKEEKIIKRVKLVPRWYKILNEFFDIFGNLKELFDSNQNENKDYNNIGMNYINFIISISILLTIFGQLYMIFFNVPIKDFGPYQFYELYHSILYIIPFVGLRYSPRILFSCSGYTLSFKYLSYIDQNKNYYFLKFIFRQLYKYLILILYMFNIRYSLYYIMCLLLGIKPMWKLFYEQELSKPENTGDFILRLLNLNLLKVISANSNNKNYNLKFNQDFFDYYWISFNEIFFFIVGILLLSLGYRFKIRIDRGIIFLTVILFILKIVLYSIFKNKLELYTTLYYYYFDYGYAMINPLFNLPYFLIGMYFGLMNYSIKEGIYEQNNYNLYKQIKKDDENAINNIIYQKPKIDNNSEDFKKDVDMDSIGEVAGLSKNRLSINETFNSSCKDSLNSKISNTYLKDLKLNPYLLTPVNIIKWHREHEFKWFLGIILFSISLIVFLFMFSYYIFKFIINDDKDFILEKTISNPALNIIYLIDIEFVVFFLHWGLFILFMKGFTYDLFKQSFWEFLSKSYFSFNMLCNPVILFIFYESETVVKLNLFNLILYFFIDAIVIIISTIIAYIFNELPMKKLFKYMFNKNYQILDLTEECNEEEEDDDDDEEKEENDDEEEKEENHEDMGENHKEKMTMF